MGLRLLRCPSEVDRTDDVTEDRKSANVADGVRGGDEVQGRDDHLVALAAADCEQREWRHFAIGGTRKPLSAYSPN
jgi:hypothetical protein